MRAEPCENEMEAHVRGEDRARVLLEAGDPAGGLDAMPAPVQTNFYARVRRLLVLAEAHQRLGHLAEGHDWLLEAHDVIATHGHVRLRPDAERLARKF